MIPNTSFTYGDDLEFVRLCEQMKDDNGRTPSEESFRALGGAWNLPATELVVLQPQQKILLRVYEEGVKEFLGKWHLPGGYVRLNKATTEDDCNSVAVRELKTGVEVIRSLDLYKWLAGEHPYGRPLSLYMHCRPTAKVIESDTCRLFEIQDLPENMVEPHRRFIQKNTYLLCLFASQEPAW